MSETYQTLASRLPPSGAIVTIGSGITAQFEMRRIRCLYHGESLASYMPDGRIILQASPDRSCMARLNMLVAVPWEYNEQAGCYHAYGLVYCSGMTILPYGGIHNAGQYRRYNGPAVTRVEIGGE